MVGTGRENHGTLRHDRSCSILPRLLQGHLPNGERLGKKVDGEILHRPGFDLTFSAPKSVSILALLGNDERIFQAIERATDKALEID